MFKKSIIIVLVLLLVSQSTLGFGKNMLGFIPDKEGVKQMYITGDLFHEKEGVVYVSTGDLAAALGYEPTYYKDSNVIIARKPGDYLIFFGTLSYWYRVDDKFESSEKPFNIGEKIYLPLESLSRLFPDLDFKIDLDQRLIQLPQEMAENLKPVGITESEIHNLSKLVFLEARDGSVIKKIAVANVVMNRMNSKRFPNSVDGVIFQRGQFPPAYYRSFKTLVPRQRAREAVVRAINGEMHAPECLFFNMVPFRGKEKDFFKNIEGDYFYK